MGAETAAAESIPLADNEYGQYECVLGTEHACQDDNTWRELIGHTFILPNVWSNFSVGKFMLSSVGIG